MYLLFTDIPVETPLSEQSLNTIQRMFLREDGQDYDIMGWSKEQVIADIVSQYEKHRDQDPDR
ncbi:hypothetical protein [Endozoicomonas euniceicola]|uniref:Uncharacterized protein n=1 Tax=Endozoicomonas euniceicola TaxID=1234143 RepID=A0ABY6GUM2_9GAMM|nr:hypothetical protein [Endozoicomonas euniceicola]UYM16478.1 hypothetical protein NX720_00655 [Endozoicomonas euniceicola]